MKILLDFRTKPSYGPVIELVNCLSEKHDVRLIPNKSIPLVGLNNNVVCCQHAEMHVATPDVVFSTYSTLPAITYVKMKYRVPVVNYMFIHMALHDFFSTKFLVLPESYKLGKILDFAAFFLPRSMLMPEKLIVPNQMVAGELIRLGFLEDKIIVLPWGLSLSKYESQHFSFPTSSSLNNDEDTIVYAGPLHPLRFSASLLYVFSYVLKRNTNARLLLLLRKDLWNQRLYDELVSTIRKLELTNKVTVARPTSHKAYLSHVARASIVILPYFSSGIVEVPPFTLLECMALSKLVITSPGIVTSGIIENGVNGFILPENLFLTANLISSLLLNKKRVRQVGGEARLTVQRNYSLINFCSTLIHILESCRP